MMEEPVMVCFIVGTFTYSTRVATLNLLFFKISTDIDECDSSFPCSQMCTNTIGSFRCSCSSGYTADGTLCNGQSVTIHYNTLLHSY